MAFLTLYEKHPMMSPTNDDNAGDFERQLADIHKVPPSLDSPVNLDIREATILNLPKLSWQNYEKPPKKMKITNTGQTVVLSGKWFSERPHLKGGALTSRYVFSQVHFHWGGDPERGSEHTVDNYRLPLEMHLVHFKAEYGSQDNALLQDDGLFVIGCFFKTEDNPAMSALTDKLEFIRRPHTSHNVTLSPVASLLAAFDGDYFSYWGSMCSDNCQHTILWCFPRTLVGISRQQMLQFQGLVNDEGWPLRMDDHSVKPLGTRRLFLVNPSDGKPLATLPGLKASVEKFCSAKSSEEILGSKASVESSKLGLSEDMFRVKTLRPASGVGSALKLRTAQQTTDLANIEPGAGISPSTSIKSAQQTTDLATAAPALEPVADVTDKSSQQTTDLSNMEPEADISPTTSIKLAQQTIELATAAPALEPVAVVSPSTSIKSAQQTIELVTAVPALKPVTVVTDTSSKQTTDLATAAPAPKPVTVVTDKSAGKPTSVAADGSSASPVDVTDTRGTVLTHPASGQAHEDLRGAGAGNADSNNNLCERGDVLGTLASQNPSVENVNTSDGGILMPKVGSSEEILRAIEELQRNQTLFNDSDSDLGSPRTSTIAVEERHSEGSLSAERPPQEEQQKVKQYIALRGPIAAKKPNAAVLPVSKTRISGASATKVKRKLAPSVAKRSKDTPKHRSLRRTLPSSTNASDMNSSDADKPLKAGSTPVSNRNFSDVRSAKETSENSQTSFYLSTSEGHDKVRSDSSSLKSSTCSETLSSKDRGSLFEGKSLVVKPKRYVTAPSSPYASKSGIEKSVGLTNSSLKAKAAGTAASFTVTAAGCWKKPSVTKVAVVPKTMPVVQYSDHHVETEVPIKCRVNPSEVRSVLEKLEREVSASLRQDKAGEFYLAHRAAGREHECRTLVRPTESIPSILGDEDSYASLLANTGDDDVYSEAKRNGRYLASSDTSSGKINWRKKKSSRYDSRTLPSEVVRWPIDDKQWRAKRTDTLLKEATALLKEHNFSVANSLDMKMKLHSYHNAHHIEKFR